MRIDAKVAAVIPPRDIAVNVGSRLGVQVGDTVTVYFSVIIKDPDTKQELGIVEYRRGRYSVSLVDENYAVASITDLVPNDSIFSAIQFAASATRPQYRTVVDRGDAPASPSDSAGTTTIFVGIGDPARVTRKETNGEEEDEDEDDVVVDEGAQEERGTEGAEEVADAGAPKVAEPPHAST